MLESMRTSSTVFPLASRRDFAGAINAARMYSERDDGVPRFPLTNTPPVQNPARRKFFCLTKAPHSEEFELCYLPKMHENSRPPPI
jgi:hypothetical protein